MCTISIYQFDKIENYFIQCVCHGYGSRSWQYANDVESYNMNKILVYNDIRIGANPASNKL